MKNILLTTAGSGNANNIMRSLRATKRPLNIIGTNIDRYELAKSLADKNYLVPKGSSKDFIPVINKIIEKEEIDLLIPNSEQEARAVAQEIDRIGTRTFIPKLSTIELCIDKFSLTKRLEKNGVNVARTVKMEEISDLYKTLDSLKNEQDDLVWCRIKEGAGSRGAAPFTTAEQIEFWIDYWKKFKGYDRNDFILSEYLPGRDYHFFSLWNNGELVIGKTCERLAYTCSKYTLSGTSSSPSVGRQVYNEEVIETCTKAVETIDKNARGIFAIDLKENKSGEPCLTEINIARFPRINIFFSRTGRYNMAEIYVGLGLGEDVGISKVVDDIDSEMYLIRDIDNEPLIISNAEIENSFQRL